MLTALRIILIVPFVLLCDVEAFDEGEEIVIGPDSKPEDIEAALIKVALERDPVLKLL